MKRKDMADFEKQSQELLRLALKLDSDVKLEDVGGQKKRTPLNCARHEALLMLRAAIHLVVKLFRM